MTDTKIRKVATEIIEITKIHADNPYLLGKALESKLRKFVESIPVAVAIEDLESILIYKPEFWRQIIEDRIERYRTEHESPSSLSK